MVNKERSCYQFDGKIRIQEHLGITSYFGKSQLQYNLDNQCTLNDKFMYLPIMN